MIIVIYKSWSVNSGWLTLFVQKLKSHASGFFLIENVANYI